MFLGLCFVLDGCVFEEFVCMYGRVREGLGMEWGRGVWEYGILEILRGGWDGISEIWFLIV